MIFLLYVDDELPLLDIGKLYLERTGEFRVDTAPSAQIALEKLKTTPYDAVVSDFQMPGMDGIQLLQAVRSINPTIPFIIFTGKGQGDVFIEAFEKGADSYLQKGGGPEPQFADLKNKIQQVVQRQHTEEALRESEEKYRNFFRTSRDCVFITTVEGRIQDMNDALVDLLGFAKDELRGISVPELYANPDDRREHIRVIQEQGYIKDYPVDLRKKDGTIINTLITSTVRWDNGGNTIGFQGTIRDITGLKRAEDALRESEEKFREIFDQVNDAIHLHEVQENGLPGRFVEVNDVACRMLRYTREELLRKGPLDFVTDYHSPPLEDIVHDLTTKGSAIFETEHKRKDGAIVPVEINARRVHLLGKDLILSIVRDITERKRADEALFLSNKKINLLSSITRHDIINQLMVLNGYIVLSRDSLEDKKTLFKFLEKMEKVSTTIERQIRFTKDYQDLGASAPEWQNVKATIEKAVTELPMRDVHVEIDRTDLEIFADPLFEKVFYNLIDNALRYGGEQMTTIRVRWQKSGNGLTIVCEDDGAGISDEDRVHLFTRGFGKNTGLGLFLSREILGITGMTIKETGIKGSGARFEITVPKGASRFPGT